MPAPEYCADLLYLIEKPLGVYDKFDYVAEIDKDHLSFPVEIFMKFAYQHYKNNNLSKASAYWKFALKRWKGTDLAKHIEKDYGEYIKQYWN